MLLWKQQELPNLRITSSVGIFQVRPLTLHTLQVSLQDSLVIDATAKQNNFLDS